eukprot:gnl/MRDRNA2_/MRDRNA2_161981_c0_seq1.p1 gnl/MRDRNA2_/MRDRNA2_161981_c0~~gnl/MRDRNA2_/MRDRNA2_161981_c0_seq1.p1  ORF type:complete len:390 (+),score=59.95 gnl/MRDRNA2_/MRDRNA2_161981_c0_seq1:142-1170(+)
MPAVVRAATDDFPAVFQYQAVSGANTGAVLRELIDGTLTTFGAIVIRGLPISSAADFSEVMHATNLNLVDYVGGVTTRPVVAPKVTPTSTEGPSVSMEPHMDNPYWPKPPTHLVVYAELPPARGAGGQSLISDNRAALKQLRTQYDEILEALENRLIRYNHFYPDEESSAGIGIPSWEQSLARDCQTASGCNKTETAERNLEQAGYQFEWIQGGLKRWELSDAIKSHPKTGEDIWANMITAMHCTVFDNHPEYPELNRAPEARGEPCMMRGSMPYDTSYGDGSPFSLETMHAMRKAQWDNAVAFDFEPGDVLVLDNYLASHGRFSWNSEVDRKLYMTMVVDQ